MMKSPPINKVSIALLAFLAMAIYFSLPAFATPLTAFITPTPANATRIAGTSANINVSISDPAVAEVKFNWNTSNYSVYNNSLMLLMNFENSSALGENNTFIIDSSKYRNNGTAAGNPVWSATNGKYGGAFRFDGIDDYISIPNSATLNNPKLTISAWIKFVGVGTNQLIAGRANYLWLANNPTFANCATSNRLSFILTDGTWRCIESSINPSANVWYHFVGAYDGSNMKVYVNGKLEGTKTGVGTPSSTYPFDIGSYSGAPSSYVTNGFIDDVKFWNVSLPADAIYEEYVSNLQKFNQSLWYLYVNQSKNATAGLDSGNYSYFASAKDTAGAEGMAGTNILSRGGSYTWQGATNNSWHIATNWDGNVVPTITDVIILNASATNQPIISANNAVALNLTIPIGANLNVSAGFNLNVDGLTSISGLLNGTNGDYTFGSLLINSLIARASLDFDGTDDYVNVSSSASLDITGPITLVAWIYPKAIDSKWHGIFSKDTWTPSENRGYSFGISSSNKLRLFYSADSATGNDCIVDSAQDIAANTWTHIAATTNGSIARVFINGVEDGSSSTNCGTIHSTSLPVAIGILNSGINNQWPFNGTIDDIRIYNRSLLASEILDNYNSIFNNSGLTGSWNFSEGSGNTTVDDSGNGNTGTLINGPAWILSDIGSYNATSGTTTISGGALNASGIYNDNGGWLNFTNAGTTQVDGNLSITNAHINSGTTFNLTSGTLRFLGAPTINIDGRLLVSTGSGIVNATLNSTTFNATGSQFEIFHLKATPQPVTNYFAIGNYVNLTNLTPTTSLLLNISYTNETNESTREMYSLLNAQWLNITTIIRNTAQNYISSNTTNITGFTTFGLFNALAQAEHIISFRENIKRRDRMQFLLLLFITFSFPAIIRVAKPKKERVLQ